MEQLLPLPRPPTIEDFGVRLAAPKFPDPNVKQRSPNLQGFWSQDCYLDLSGHLYLTCNNYSVFDRSVTSSSARLRPAKKGQRVRGSHGAHPPMPRCIENPSNRRLIQCWFNICKTYSSLLVFVSPFVSPFVSVSLDPSLLLITTVAPARIAGQISQIGLNLHSRWSCKAKNKLGTERIKCPGSVLQNSLAKSSLISYVYINWCTSNEYII